VRAEAADLETPWTPGSLPEVVSGLVKWFDRARGFGFVLVGPDRRDAILPAAVLRKDGLPEPVQGDRLVCTVREGDRGLYVTNVCNISHPGEVALVAPIQMDGKVKFYDAVRGYGFILADTGEEVFVGAKLLRRLGVKPLRDAQSVRVTASLGPQGLVAETLTFPP
jgi:CspA family cold shock protein